MDTFDTKYMNFVSVRRTQVQESFNYTYQYVSHLFSTYIYIDL